MQTKMIIQIDVEKELDYEADSFGGCDCGCGKTLFKGMTVLSLRYETIYIGCLEKFLNDRKLVL